MVRLAAVILFAATLAATAREIVIVDTDSHEPGDLITRDQAERVARGAGLSDAEVATLFANVETFARRLANL
jgi:signal recognition particle GTPase